MNSFDGVQVFLWSLLTGASPWNRFVDKGTAINAIAWERNMLFCAADTNVKVAPVQAAACLVHDDCISRALKCTCTLRFMASFA